VFYTTQATAYHGPRLEMMGAVSSPARHASARREVMRWLLAVLLAILSLASCAPAPPPPRLTATAPEWRVGDRWRHTWRAGTEQGTKTSEVLSVREVGGVPFYVLRVDTVARYYTFNLHWAANEVESRVAARAQPPQPWFTWPLEVGKQWNYQGTYEDQEGKGRLNETYSVIAMEPVEVPAGKFSAFKLSRQGAPGSTDEYWYAPEVRWYVKWLGRRGNETFDEVLLDFVPGPTPPRSPPAGGPPGGARE